MHGRTFRAARATALAVLAAIVVACGAPLRDFGEEPKPTTAPTPVAFDALTLKRLATLRPVRRVTKQAVRGAADFTPVTAILSTMWQAYLARLNDGRLATHPTRMAVVEADDGQTFGDICNLGPDHRYPELRQPTYCPDHIVGDAAPARLVLPHGFTAKVQAFGAAHGQREAWILAAMVAGKAFAIHLRQEMAVAGFAWPDSRRFDYCTCGIGLRALFPARIKELTAAKLGTIFSALDALTSPPDNPAARLQAVRRGYAAGRLDRCTV